MIIALYRSPQVRREMGEEGVQVWERHYTLPRIAAQYYELFQAIGGPCGTLSKGRGRCVTSW